MASDAFPKPAIPEPLRDFVKLSIDQARRAFETFAATSEKTRKSFESLSPLGRGDLFALNAKIAEITRQNAEANFACSRRWNCRAAQTFAQQLEAMRDLATEIIQEAARGGPGGADQSRRHTKRSSGR